MDESKNCVITNYNHKQNSKQIIGDISWYITIIRKSIDPFMSPERPFIERQILKLMLCIFIL